MRATEAFAILAAAAGLAACTLQVPRLPAPADPDPAVPARPGTPAGGDVAIFVERVNAHRRSAGCRPLEWDAAVARAAQGHSDAMRARGFYSHTDPDGRSFTDRLSAVGVEWLSAAENIARTASGPEEVLYLWLQSAGHRENIENCRFTHHGVGLAGELWTHLFVTPDPRGTPDPP